MGITECSEVVDAYEIATIDECIAVVDANPRAVLHGVFELEDLIAENDGIPKNLRSRAVPTLNLRLFHPRSRGGFHSYQRCDIEFIARIGANVAHLNHDWMSEKNLFSFVPCPEFLKANILQVLTNNRKRLRQYIDWCNQFGLRPALWLSEIPCQGGPWTPEISRAAFLEQFPKEVLSDTGTYQGMGLCLAHPLVEQAYRGMVRRLLSDFPGIEMVLVFTLDSNGELRPSTFPATRSPLRTMLFHPELTEPLAAHNFIRGLAEKLVGEVAAPDVMAAWREIEAAQQIQSNHTYYWHHLRPNWAGPTLLCSCINTIARLGNVL